MIEATKVDKLNRKGVKVIKEGQSKPMRKRMDTMRMIEDNKNGPALTTEQEFNELFNSL